MFKPKVSIVIPVYNGEKYIEKAIESAIIPDSDIDIEIIVVDDGSADNTATIVKNIQEDHDNVVYIRQENSGAQQARKNGALNARGEYIMFCDADDTLESSNLVPFIRYAYDNDLDILIGSSHDFSQDDSINRINNNKVNGRITRSRYIDGLLTSKVIIGPACRIFRKSLVSESCFDTPKCVYLNEDLYMNLSLAIKADKIEIRNEVVIYNHMTDNLESIGHTKIQSEEAWLILFERIKSLLQNDPNHDDAIYSFYCMRLYSNYLIKGIRPINTEKFAISLFTLRPDSISRKNRLASFLIKHPSLIPIFGTLVSAINKIK